MLSNCATGGGRGGGGGGSVNFPYRTQPNICQCCDVTVERNMKGFRYLRPKELYFALHGNFLGASGINAIEVGNIVKKIFLLHWKGSGDKREKLILLFTQRLITGFGYFLKVSTGRMNLATGKLL